MSQVFNCSRAACLWVLGLSLWLPHGPGLIAESWTVNEDAKSVPEKTATDGVGTPGSPSKAHQSDAKAFDQKSLTPEADARLSQALGSAWQKQAAAIRSHWGEVLVSDASRWVTYTPDWGIRRAVDYQANEIAITLPAVLSKGESRIDFDQTAQVVTEHVSAMLSTTVAEALASDPLFAEPFREAGLSELKGAQVLVFSELFDRPGPSKSEVTRRAKRLMQDAEIGFYQVQASANPAVVSLGQTRRLTYKIPLPHDRILRKARQYRSTILELAEKMDVPTDLVFAIIHTESHFNPLARSPVPAYGLMQIVPHTAGRDASRLLFDEPQTLSPTYLFNPENNIEVGVAYLRMLYTHYLKDIQDPSSRLYCAIAAYNTGVINVARAFGDVPSMQQAASEINKLSSQQVLAALLASLPAQETRDYLKKVLARKSLYARV